MALTVKHLNSDASFLLSFEPVIPESIADSVLPHPFTILLDPWITGPSTIFHPRISNTTQKHPACISSLTELLRPPDLVIISQHNPDHCNEATLRQLPANGSTQILAEPASARIIRGWNYFDKNKIRTIRRWEDPRITGKQSVIRIPVPPVQPNGAEGEVTIAFIPQKRDLAGLHGAVGITYRSPPTHDVIKQETLTKVLTPPSTPEAQGQIPIGTQTGTPIIVPTGDTFLLPPTPPISPISPISPTSLRSIRSASTLIASPTHSLYSPHFRPATSSQNEPVLPPSPYSLSRPISLIFSPHGIQYSHLAAYATSHLVAEAALPLTALLHCMDSINNPWWLGGNICAGVPYGAEIASKLGARVWVSAHDGEKDVRGLATGMLKTRRWRDEEIEGALVNAQKMDRQDKSERKGRTKILRLKCGEEILISGTGQLWRTNTSAGGVQLDEKPATETFTAPSPPSPPTTTIMAMTTSITKHQGKYDKKGLESLTLSQVQDVMSPKKLGIYKALRTLDLIKPSPRLIIEHEVTSAVMLPISTQSSAQVKTEKETESLEAVSKRDSSNARSVAFALPTQS
ncbi:hypothetical protein F5B22DRAFT_609901 [Xylaria bambusicola]|uniref:uncharacterized protein n=1 Tax=Xylaria bambusicola TaxID=326684 RepID=UPI002007CF3D|nr:uncharacterized protein F5B22DRAFT_609901 [Xylaria bambusicola]KAI0514837.1 hypothetical protein F5B22DRAFT_609901 [Xylaria bambusicola]